MSPAALPVSRAAAVERTRSEVVKVRAAIEDAAEAERRAPPQVASVLRRFAQHAHGVVAGAEKVLEDVERIDEIKAELVEARLVEQDGRGRLIGLAQDLYVSPEAWARARADVERACLIRRGLEGRCGVAVGQFPDERSMRLRAVSRTLELGQREAARDAEAMLLRSHVEPARPIAERSKSTTHRLVVTAGYTLAIPEALATVRRHGWASPRMRDAAVEALSDVMNQRLAEACHELENASPARLPELAALDVAPAPTHELEPSPMAAEVAP